MTSDTEQENNNKWLFDFINRPLSQATFSQVIKFSSGRNSEIDFNRSLFFSLSDIKCNLFEKQFHFDSNKINKESLNYLSELFKNDDILICYELSDQTKSILDALEINYIDIWLHPIRYLDDVLFGMTSNNENIRNELIKHNISTDTYYLYADRIKVQNYKGHRRSKTKIKPNSALFIGQTLIDKAVFLDGRMLTLLDFKNHFELITKKYNHVYYSRHPFVKEGDEEILAYIQGFKNVSVIQDPTYHLLSTPEIDFVFSISSSVVYEATYFEKEVEFLYKPVIEIGDHNSKYTSIMHNIFYSHFWASVLHPIISTKQVSNVKYFCGKDKTRDALSFYWGYRDIDKTESLKQTVSSLWYKSGKNKSEKVMKHNNENIYEKIEKSNLVSFDIFDTLITRKTFSPRELFNIIEEKFNEKYSFRIHGFKKFRVLAEDQAHKDALTNKYQECTLDEIYNLIPEIMGIPHNIAQLLKKTELETELEYSIPRNRGIELFNHALKCNKNIILTSDMYLSKSFIEKLLIKNKIFGYNEIFVSSEVKLKKQSGDLFKYISDILNVSFEEILHIGDNVIGDFEVPTKLGIKAYRTPRSIDNAKFHNPNLKKWIDVISINKTPLIDSVITLISNKFHDNETITKSSLFNGDAFELGYKGLGPLIIGFTAWVRQQSIQNKIEMIYFLSRDSKIIYDCYKTLYSEESNNIKYLYSSRRSVRPPLIENRNDIFNEVYKTIYSTTIAQWLENSFGLSRDLYDESIIKSFGLTGYDQPIGVKFSKETLKNIVIELEEQILLATRNERENIIGYLESEGVNRRNNVAVIDIGYAGTMQSAYRKLLKKENIYGFYLATFNTALKNIPEKNLIKGYCMNFGSPNHSLHAISSHRFIYETLLCDTDGSFIKPIKSEDGYHFIKSTFDDSIRHQAVKEIHSGVRSLAADLKGDMPTENLDSFIDPFIGGLALTTYLKEPEIKDAMILSGIIFEDASAPNARKYVVIPDELKNNETAINNMIWKESAKFFIKTNKKQNLQEEGNRKNIQRCEKTKHSINHIKIKLSKLLLSAERKILSLTLNERKYNKYMKDRDVFFYDSPQKASAIYFSKTKKLIK